MKPTQRVMQVLVVPLWLTSVGGWAAWTAVHAVAEAVRGGR